MLKIQEEKTKRYHTDLKGKEWESFAIIIHEPLRKTLWLGALSLQGLLQTKVEGRKERFTCAYSLRVGQGF